MTNNMIQIFYSLFEIWIRPRGTIRRIVSNYPTKFVYLIAALYGVCASATFVEVYSKGARISFPGVVAVLALGGLLGLFILFFVAVLFRWTAAWFGGRAAIGPVRVAVAWGLTTAIIFEILEFARIYLVQGLNPVAAYIFSTGITPRELDLIFSVVSIIFGLWSLIVRIKCLAQVENFSFNRAFGAAIVPLLLASLINLGWSYVARFILGMLKI